MTEGLVQAEEDLAVLLDHVGSDRRPAARAEMAQRGHPGVPRDRRRAAGRDLLQHAGPDPDGASPAAVLFRGLSRQRLVEKGAALRAAGRLRILADDARVRLSNGCGILAASVRLMITSLASLPPGTSLDELHPVAPS